MKTLSKSTILIATCLFALASCSPNEQREPVRSMLEPAEIIDLGALVTEDLPERVAGKAFLTANGYERPNSSDVIHWEVERWGGSVSGSNAYYTLYNHGGPHVDAPNHVGLEGGLDSYPIEAFAGPRKSLTCASFQRAAQSRWKYLANS